MTRIVSIAACVALTGVLLAGCGSSSKKSTGGSSTIGAKTATTAAPVGAGEVKVSMKNIMDVPANVTAKVGQTIKWTNDDPFPHTVTAISGAKFDSGVVNPSATYAFKVTKAGTIAYHCTIHPNQTGTITVTR